jgi:hypothetical protein
VSDTEASISGPSVATPSTSLVGASLWVAVVAMVVALLTLGMVIWLGSGYLAIFAALPLAVAVGAQLAAFVLALLDRARRGRGRSVGAVAMLAAAMVGIVAVIGLLTLWDAAHWARIVLPTPVVATIAVTLPATVLLVARADRPGALVLVGTWAFLGLPSWNAAVSHLDVEIEWAGPAPVTGAPAIYWVAGASGDFNVHLGGSGCGDGRVIETGRYVGPLETGQTRGKPAFTEIPLDSLEPDGMTTIRVCVSSGLAGGSAERWVDAGGTAHRF